MIIDNFLDSFEELKARSKEDCFDDMVSPIDGVTYPLICTSIPANVEREVFEKLGEFIDRDIENPSIFMRRCPKGVDSPNKVHSDISMGLYTCMVYINDPVDGSGTSLVKHRESGITHNPELEEFVDIVIEDRNNDESWEVLEMIEMVPNRAFIFRADALHRAEPIGGFGEGKEARVVLTCFFS